MSQPTPSSAKTAPHVQRWWMYVSFGALLFLSILGLTQIPSWSKEQRIERYLPGPWQQQWQSLAAVNQRFGFDRSLVILLEAPPQQDVFSPVSMQINREMTQKLSGIAGVQRVLSLSNGVTIRKQGDAMVVRPLMPASLDKYGISQQQELRKLALGDPLLRGSLIAAQGQATLFLVTLHPALLSAPASPPAPGQSAPPSLSQTVQAVLALVRNMQTKIPQARWGVVGQPFVSPLLQEALLSQVPQVPLLFVMWNLLLILLLIPTWRRKLWFVGVSLCAMFLAVASHMGWYQNIHLSVLWIPLWVWWILGNWAMFSPASSALSHRDEKAPTLSAMPRTWMWFATVLVASWGLSLWLHPWPMMQRWGITTALTILGILALAWFFTPPSVHQPSSTTSPRSVLQLSPLVSGMLGLAILFLGIGTAWLSISFPGLQHTYPRYGLLFHGERISQQHFGGAAPFFVRFQGNLQDPVLLKAMVRVGQRLEQLSGVSSVQSYGVIVRQLHAMLNQLPRIPDSQLKISSLAILLEGQPALASLIREKNQDGIIQGRISIKNPLQQHALLAGMQQALQGLPLRYQTVSLKTASPAVHKTLFGQRALWVAEGITLWLKRTTQHELSSPQQRDLYKLLYRYLDYIHQAHTTFVVEPYRLQQGLTKYLHGEESDLELNASEKAMVLRTLLKLNLRGQLQQPDLIQQALVQALAGSSAAKDQKGLRYATRSIMNVVQTLQQNQQIFQLQQQIFQWLGTQREWMQHALPKLRKDGPETARTHIASLQGELLELHNPQWVRTDQGSQQLVVSHTGLHQFLLPLAKVTAEYGLRTAWLLLLASFLLCWVMFRSLSSAWAVWLPIPITLFVTLGLLGWLDIPLDLSLIFLLLFLGGFVLYPSLYLHHYQRGLLPSTSTTLTPRQVLVRMALWISLPATPLLLVSLPPIQHVGLVLTLGPWLAVLSCLPSLHLNTQSTP